MYAFTLTMFIMFCIGILASSYKMFCGKSDVERFAGFIESLLNFGLAAWAAFFNFLTKTNKGDPHGIIWRSR